MVLGTKPMPMFGWMRCRRVRFVTELLSSNILEPVPSYTSQPASQTLQGGREGGRVVWWCDGVREGAAMLVARVILGPDV